MNPIKSMAVISLSKIKNLKAIHNRVDGEDVKHPAVISLSKIKNLKAIHNHSSALSTRCGYDSMTCRYAPIFYLA